MAESSFSPSAATLDTLGVWQFTDRLSAADAVAFARRLEELGYSALWIPDTVGRDPFAHAALLLAETERLVLATGIANIHHRHPGPMLQAALTLAEQSGGRFVLGVGVSHAPLVEGLRGLDYSRPVSTMRRYLDAMDASPYTAPPPSAPPPRLLAALGPRMLALAAERADGAHPYWTTPEHTETAREILGPGKLLCVEQKCVLTTDPATARATARAAMELYAGLPNYTNNWKRLGFSDDDIAQRSDRLVDALVAWGDADAIAARIHAHRDAGADHVCIQVLPTDPDAPGAIDPDALAALAPGGAA
ncbi:MAG: TIGR03620 family F420-dependent LLM class oxidoreductase [Actinomyces sp.]|nr:MAG: TIGR03620 family F420-dependent LLM class oxidoreductase [Actinomyces sp.]